MKIYKYPYKAIKVNGKKIDEHRYIMETFLGRKLEYNETIHHINGNKRDNRLENLEILNRREHTLIHHKQGDLRSPTKDESKKSILTKYGHYRFVDLENNLFECRRCERILHKNNFRLNNGTYYKISSRCRDCLKEIDKDYNLNRRNRCLRNSAVECHSVKVKVDGSIPSVDG